jgi:hypothetical protein
MEKICFEKGSADMKRLLSSLFFLSCLMASVPVYASTQNLNSYYPAPQGDYKDIIVNNLFTLSAPGAPCTTNGNNVYLSNVNGILSIGDASGSGNCYPISRNDLWTGNGTYMYPTNLAENVSIGLNAATTASVATLDVIAPGFMHVAGTSSGATTYPVQGAFLNWNIAGGIGEMDFVDNKGAGTGGFRFYNFPTPGLNPLAIISGTGDVTIGTNTANNHTFNGTTTIVGTGGGGLPNLVVNGRIQTGDAANVGGVWLSNAGNMLVGENGTTAGFWNNVSGWSLLVAPGGNVGIGPGPVALLGDTNPGATLEVTQSDAVTFQGVAATSPSIMVCTNSTRSNCGHLAVTQDITDNNFYAVYSP